eukprot:7077295-Lingulodinium_polyedra.AAC.1
MPVPTVQPRIHRSIQHARDSLCVAGIAGRCDGHACTPVTSLSVSVFMRGECVYLRAQFVN